MRGRREVLLGTGRSWLLGAGRCRAPATKPLARCALSPGEAAERENGLEEVASPTLEEVAPLRALQRGLWRVVKGDCGPAEPLADGVTKIFLKFFVRCPIRNCFYRIVVWIVTIILSITIFRFCFILRFWRCPVASDAIGLLLRCTRASKRLSVFCASALGSSVP